MFSEPKGSKVLGELRIGDRVEGWHPKSRRWVKISVTKVSAGRFQGIDRELEGWTGLTKWRSPFVPAPVQVSDPDLEEEEFYLAQHAGIDLSGEECLPKLTSAQEMESASSSQVLNVDSSSLESQKPIQTAAKSLASDTPELSTMGMSITMTGTETQPRLTSLQPHHPVSHSACKEKGLQQMTRETVSLEFSGRSPINSPSSLQSKTLEVYSTVPIAPELTEVTFGMFYTTFPASGSILNGRCYQADTLERPSLEKESFWLGSLGGLSHGGIGQAPGWSKSESQLHKLGALKRGEVINPDLAESAYRVPIGWTNRQVITTAGEFLAEMGKLESVGQRLETHSIPALQVSRSTAFYTCPSCAKRLEFLDFRADCNCFQWFTTLAWNEQDEWDEPLDPDDVWRVGDRIRWKSNNVEGTVKDLQQREILGGKLSYLIVRFDGATADVLLAPDQVWKLNGSPLAVPLETFQVGDFVEFGCGVAQIVGLTSDQAELLTAETNSIWQGLDTLKLARKVEDKYGCWWQVGLNNNVPIWHNPQAEILHHSCGETYVVLEQDDLGRALVVKKGLRPRRLDAQDLEGWAIGCSDPWWLNIEEHFAPVKRRRGGRGKDYASGWLEKYTKEKKLKGGVVASYPRVAERDPDNVDHWYWAFRYEEKKECAKSDNGYVTRAVSVPRSKVEAVKLAITCQWSVEKILKFIRGEENQ